MSQIFSTALLSVVLSSVSFAEVTKSAANIALEGNTLKGFVYEPSTPSSKMIFLQHGFARSAQKLDDLATSLAEKGNIVVSMNLGFGQHRDRNLAKAMAKFLATDRKLSDSLTLPSDMVLMGHSAGGLFVSRVGGAMEQDHNFMPKGYLMLDGVDADGDIVAVFKGKSKVPKLAISAEPSSCNQNSQLTSELKGLSTASFVGVKINGSTHCSPEGATSDFLCTSVCGGNPSKVTMDWKDIAGTWANMMLEGKDSTAFEGYVKDGMEKRIYTKL